MHISVLKSKIAVCQQFGDIITKYKNTKSSRDVPRISRNDKKIYFFVVCAALYLWKQTREMERMPLFLQIYTIPDITKKMYKVS